MVLMDLSKEYDCLPHDLLMAKLNAYGVGIDSLKLIYSFLTDRKQRVKIGTSFSTWKYLPKGVPQGTVLGPLLVNIFINVDIRRKNTTMLLSVQYMFRIVPIHHQLLITMKNFLVHKQTLNHQSNLLVEKGINVAKTGKNG